VAVTVFRVQPVGHRWELRRDGTLLYSHGDRQRVIDNGEATAKGNRPSRFIVHRRDGSIEHETCYELDVTEVRFKTVPTTPMA